MRRIAWTTWVGVALGVVACGRSDVTITPPRVPQGGRAVAIAVSQSDAKRLVVATESGGLFRTFDGGTSFQHMDAFPTMFVVDVAMASLDHNVVIATAKPDFRATSGSGIWRSADGAVTWKRPVGWPPAGCGSRPTAAGISHMPLSRTFHVATDCGLATSTDNGATFTVAPIDPANRMLFSVLVLNRSTGVAADNRRIWFLNNGQWTASLGGPDSGATFTPHAFAAPWWAASNIVYHAGRDRRLWVSTTSGGAWRMVNTPCDLIGKSCGNREPFVRVGRAIDGDPTHFDVYYGDGFTLWRQTMSVADPIGQVSAWKEPDHMDHRDPADLAFTPGFEAPLMLATDGGVHLTPDNGKNWKLTGSAFGGFTALQVTEVTGRAIPGAKAHQDLYYATQDNDIKASNDGGQTWNGSLCCEGAYLRADAMNPSPSDGPLTGRQCGPCSLFEIPGHPGSVPSPPAFHSAPSGTASDVAGPPFQLLGDAFLQAVPNTEATPPSDDYFFSADRGAQWTPAFTVPGSRIGVALFGGDMANPITYVARQKGSGAALVRASGVSGAITVVPVDSVGIFTVGLLPTGQSRAAVAAVDPKAPDHLLAFDLFLGARASVDGGRTWFGVSALEAAVSDSNRFIRSLNGIPQVTTIAWDPTNSCHILVGTMQNGVIRSADGGTTWSRVRGSALVPWVSSFYFPPTGAIRMSSYGRGLWTLSVDRRPPSTSRCQFPRPPGTVTVPDPPVVILAAAPTQAAPPRWIGFGDPVVCATCSTLLVHDGWITDVLVDGGVRAIGIAGGYVEQRDKGGREVPLSISNAMLQDETPALRRLTGDALAGERRVRGLVLDGTRLVATLVGRDPPRVSPLRSPMVTSRPMGGDSVQVIGDGFLPGRAEAGVTLAVGADTVRRGIPVAANGRFAVMLHPRAAPGLVTLVAIQRDGRRTTEAMHQLQVEGSDRAER